VQRVPAPIGALLFTTTVGILAFIAVLWGVDPATAGFLELVVFCASLFTALAGGIAFGFMYFSSNRFRKNALDVFGISLRRGLLIAAVLISLLMLQDAGTLGPFTVLPLLVAAAYIEFRTLVRLRITHLWRKNR